MQRNKILIVDDEEVMRDSLLQVLSREKYVLECAESGSTALESLAEKNFDLVILDLRMPGMDGLQLLDEIRRKHPGIAAIVITGYATLDNAVTSMKKGACDFLPKPFTPESIRNAVRNILIPPEPSDKSAAAPPGTPAQKPPAEETAPRGWRLVGKSPEMKKVRDLIARVAPTDSTVLITGESGTGKELIAREIHRKSKRSGKPFVAVDCGTLVDSLFESELFGHQKGSFTGATATTHGRFEIADGGTIFFDEIGNISRKIQAKLLRVIQEREFTRVGSGTHIRVDVRIIAATNRDLAEETGKGDFREDLFYRLNVVPIMVPPLRDRKEDIPILAEYFLEKHTRERGKKVAGFSAEAMEILKNQNWGGNVRELENAIERAVVLTETEEIIPPDLLFYMVMEKPGRTAAPSGPASLGDIERAHIESVLRKCNWNRKKTADELGIDRKTLWRKIREFGIEEKK